MKITQFVTCSLDTIFYCIFADGSPQTWNEPNSDSQEKKEENKPKRDWFLVSLDFFELPIMNQNIFQILWTVLVTLGGSLYVIISVVLHSQNM